MTIKYHYDLIQHTDEWKQARCGLLTASEMEKIITPAKLQVANNDESRSHVDEIAAQRINHYVEPTWFGGAMERGVVDEIDARHLYSTYYAPVTQCGFITNDEFTFIDADGNEKHFTLGYSTDGLVEIYDDGLYSTPGVIESKSANQKKQMRAILSDSMPAEHVIQVQTGLLVTKRPWCDFISYCSGMPMFTKRIVADAVVQAAIISAAQVFHQQLDAKLRIWDARISDKEMRLIPTERKIINTGEMKETEE